MAARGNRFSLKLTKEELVLVVPLEDGGVAEHRIMEGR